MIEPEKRRAIYLLHQEGMSLREIARRLRVSRNTARSVIKENGAMAASIRRDKIQIDPELLRRLYRECDGWKQRVHEKLQEEEGIEVKDLPFLATALPEKFTYSIIGQPPPLLRRLGVALADFIRESRQPISTKNLWGTLPRSSGPAAVGRDLYIAIL